MQQSEITFITPESVSVLYEALSTNTKVYVFDHELHVDGQHGTKDKPRSQKYYSFKKQSKVGYIDTKRHLFSRSVKSADLHHPKKKNHCQKVNVW